MEVTCQIALVETTQVSYIYILCHIPVFLYSDLFLRKLVNLLLSFTWSWFILDFQCRTPVPNSIKICSIVLEINCVDGHPLHIVCMYICVCVCVCVVCVYIYIVTGSQNGYRCCYAAAGYGFQRFLRNEPIAARCRYNEQLAIKTKVLPRNERHLRGNGYCQMCLLSKQLVTMQYERWDKVFRIRSN
jgi:hypothetical protein